MILVFTFRRLDFIILSGDGYVKTHCGWSTSPGCVLKNLQGSANLMLVNTNKPISLFDLKSNPFKLKIIIINPMKSINVNDDTEPKGKQTNLSPQLD